MLTGEARHLGEQRSGDDAAVDRGLRLVEDDDDRHTRVLGREVAGKARDVGVLLVAERLQVRLLRRAGLPCDSVADDGRLLACALGHDALHHPGHEVRGLGRHDAHAVVHGELALLALRIDLAAHQAHRHPHPVVGERVVHAEHLECRDGEALSDRDRRLARSGPILRQDASRFAGELDAGLLPESEGPQIGFEPLRLEALCDLDRADVRRHREDVTGSPSHVGVVLVVFELVVRHL